MKKITEAFNKFLTLLSIYYIKFVYKTSKILSTGTFKLILDENDEKFIMCFWHGDSYSLYPYLEGKDLYVITTANKRGDYVSMICSYFGYKPLRVPDESHGGNYLFKVKREINGSSRANLTITLDGPLGPYHEPKSLAFITAVLTKRKVLPLTINCKRKIYLKRWDKFVMPLPFNEINLHFYDPIEVKKSDLENDAVLLRKQVKNIMENNS